LEQINNEKLINIITHARLELKEETHKRKKNKKRKQKYTNKFIQGQGWYTAVGYLHFSCCFGIALVVFSCVCVLLLVLPLFGMWAPSRL
jgi:hypothetical protein